jgi:tRNA pseudouridine38-40 synthase
MTTFKMTIAYDGTKYQGWQRLGNTDMTIQGKIEAVLSRIYTRPILIDGSGRTDAGVHAKGQIASVELPKNRIDPKSLGEINHYLPEDIQIMSMVKADDRFHARFNAKQKIYRYRISVSPSGNVFERKEMIRIEEPLNLEAMRSAASYLIGEHDFQSFTAMKSKTKSTVRTIESITVTALSDEIQIDFLGNGFLRQQVRLMMGLLIQVAQGVVKPKAVKEILDEKSRANTRAVAPAKGLCLERVIY